MINTYSTSPVFFRNLDYPSVDQVRSHPLYYANGEFSPNPEYLIHKHHLTRGSMPVQEWEFRQSGYVTGNETLIKGLYQVTAGQWLHDGKVENYYEYKPNPGNKRSTEELGSVLDGIFRQVIWFARGSLIAVPLSGGLDSRLIICKLHELGYNNLIAFSYGKPNNDEAGLAKAVCKTLHIPWFFLPTTHKSSRAFYGSPQGAAYLKYAFDYATVPNIQDAEVVSRLNLPKDSIIINGQAGDFISGGHIPKEDVFYYLVKKHFNLWKTKDPIYYLVDNWRDYETWEWRERQSKYVIGGQRAYDFYGYRWDLPLWYPELMDFFQSVPLEQKMGQALYRKYLQEWNYCGLFKKSHEIRRYSIPVMLLARLLFPARDLVYRYGRYWGYYGYQYGPFGFRQFMKHSSEARNAVSLLSQSLM